jgi:hypothetical protein
VVISDFQVSICLANDANFCLRREMLGRAPSALYKSLPNYPLFHDATDRWTPGTPTCTKVTVANRLAKLSLPFKNTLPSEVDCNVFGRIGQLNLLGLNLYAGWYFNGFLSFVFVSCRIYLK